MKLLLHSRIIHLSLIALFVGLLFLPTLNYEFVGDDWDFVTEWPAIAEADVSALLAGDVPGTHQGTYRPGRSLLYLMAYQTWGEQSLYYQLFGVVVHGLITALVYLIVTRLSSRQSGLITALLFAWHPVHIEAVTFITASFDTASFVFLLASFYLYMLSVETKQKYWNWALALGLVAISINETSLVLPGLIGLYLCVFRQQKPRKVIDQIKPYLLMVAAWLFLRYFVVGISLRSNYWGDDMFYSLLISLKSFVWYFYVFLWPVDLGLIHELPGGISSFMFRDLLHDAVLAQSIFEPILWLGLVLIAGIGWSLWKLPARQPLLVFGFSWIAVSLLPVINIIPSAVIFSERYGYLASFGFCLILAQVILWLIQSRKLYGWLVLSLVLAGYAQLSVELNQTWQDEITYWQYNTSQAPDNFLAWYMKGQVYQKRYLVPEALEAYRLAFSLEPNHPNPMHNSGMIYHFLGKYPEAIEHYQLAYEVAEMPQTALSMKASHLAYAQQLEKIGRYEEAKVQREKAERLD